VPFKLNRAEKFGIAMVIFAAIITIPATIIANDSSNQSSPASDPSSAARPTQSASSTPQVASSSPSPSSPISSSPTPSGSGDVTSSPTQSSYRLQWQGTLTIGLAGVNVDQTGIHASDGEIYDLQYQPGSSGGWRTVVSAEIAFLYWLPKSTPRPESCVGVVNGSGTYSDPTDKVANINDRYCFVNDDTEPTVVAYMHVTSVSANGVTVKVRLWDHT
jgi:hypothetical protein